MKRIVAFITLMLAFLVGGLCQSQAFKSMGNEEFAKAISKKSVQVVDVRTQKEFADGHLKRAVNIDVNNKSFLKLAEEKLDKKRPVAVYCLSGGRSKNAAKILSNNGFTVYELNTGYRKWNGETVK